MCAITVKYVDDSHFQSFTLKYSRYPPLVNTLAVDSSLGLCTQVVGFLIPLAILKL